jgi:manganese oxidase
MTMGETGMGGHAEHMKHMDIPKNSIPMLGAPGPFSYIDMGGMFTILKVRDGITSYADPGWYQNPAGTVASSATQRELEADLGVVKKSAEELKMPQGHQHH